MHVRRSLTVFASARTLAGAALSIASTGAAWPQQAPLFPLPAYETGNLPEDIAAGDVTGDGHLDLVTADRLAGTLTVLSGNGAGDFAAAASLPTGGQPAGIALADVSGDGLADVVCGNAASSTLTLHVADGAGGFLAPQTLPAPYAAETVLAGDLNGDGGTDLVSVAFAPHTVVIQLGDGGGGFLASATGFVGGGPRDAILADLDGDGDLDVVTANQNGGSLSILSGNGAGGFAGFLTLPAVASLKSVAVGDLDADGQFDLAAGTSGFFPIVEAWLGTGAGTFAAPVSHPLGGSAYALAIADVDADAKLDIVAADMTGGELRWLGGDGAGGFLPAQVVPVAHAPWAMAVQDLDADGDLDVALAMNGSDHATVLLAQSPAVFPANVHVGLAGTTSASIVALAVGDVDGDDVADVVSIKSDPFAVQLVAGDGAGGLLPPQLIASASFPADVQLADMNGDGASDLVYLSSNIVNDFTTVQLGNGAGGFAAPVSTLVPESIDLATGDVNGDGHADAVTLQYDFSSQPGQIHVLPGDGAGGLGAPAGVVVTSDAADLKDVLLADVTDDGRQDVLVLGDAWIYVMAGDAQGGFVPSGKVGLGLPLSQAWTLAAGDFDADGDVDLATPDNEHVDVLINAGSGTFLPSVTLHAQKGAKRIAQRDLDGDGLQDLVTANDTSGSVTVFRGEGAGGFAAGQHFVVAEGAPSRMAVADMDGDGAPDLVLGHSDPPSITVMRNLGGGSAWTDLGHALAGALGAPTLAGTGELVEGTPGSIVLGNAAPLAPAVLFVSLVSQPQPFKGGLLVPVPAMLVLPLPTGPDGTLVLAFTWPSGVPTGTNVYLQMAIQDAGAPADVALSNALKGMAD